MSTQADERAAFLRRLKVAEQACMDFSPIMGADRDADFERDVLRGLAGADRWYEQTNGGSESVGRGAPARNEWTRLVLAERFCVELRALRAVTPEGRTPNPFDSESVMASFYAWVGLARADGVGGFG